MKKYYTLYLLLLLIVSVWAVDANEFLIGAYSQYQIRYAGENFAAKFDSLGVYLNNAGYNATVYSLTSEHESRLSTIFQKLHESNIKSMLHDNTWSPHNGRLGVGSTTFGNRLQIEAEYQLKTEVVNGNTVFVVDDLSTENQTLCMESYDYVTKHEVGNRVYDTGEYQYSNGFAWLCDSNEGHTAGIALSYPRKRWKPSWASWPSLLSKDIVFYTNAINDNKLYISVAIQHEDVALGDPVASVKLKLYLPPPDHIEDEEYDQFYYEDEKASLGQYVSIPLTPSYVTSDGTTIKNYPYTGVQFEHNTGNMIYEYWVDLSTLKDYMNGTDRSATREFYHINPEIYWHGNGKLIIDYITIEDDINRSVRSDPNSPYFTQIDSQISTLSGYDTNDNLLFLMGMDEPRAGQLQMYKHMQNHLNSINPPRKMATAMWLKDYGIIKHDGVPYNHHKRFLHESNPDRIMVDIYPLLGSISWNGSAQTVQSKIDNMIHYYYHKLVKSVQQSNNPDTEIFYIPQTFGIVLEDSGNWSYNMPPLSMLKVLKYLPLCYAADGMVDFCIASNPTSVVEDGNWVTPLIHDTIYGRYDNLRVPDHMSAYDYLSDANRKIAVYGPIIKGLTWLNANKLMTTGIFTTSALNHEDSIPLNSVYLDDIYVDATIDSTGYRGHIQSGYYNDNQGIPYFMLVNRRAVYKKSNISSIPLKHVDLRFNDAAPQSVCFEPDDPSHGIFGTHIALYDPYDDKIYKSTSGVIDVKIDPGDGKLLQMCSSLPPFVTSDADIKGIAYMDSSITIDQGAVVTIHPGTITNIFAQSTILVKGGSTLNISGTVNIADNVSIIVENGSNIIFDNAICNWGINSILKVENSGITANSTILQSANAGETWQGLRIDNAGTIGMVGTTITGAKSNEVTNSQVLLTNCRFNIPTAGTGLSIINSLPNQNVRITSSTNSKGFYSMGPNSIGLFLENPNANLFLNNIVFDGLSFGFVSYLSSDVEDTIQNCYFSNNGTGLILQDLQNSPLISNCTFYQNAKGAHFYAASPKVTECEFTGCDVGIRTELATATTGGIYDSIFSQGETAIVSRGSNQRVSKNTFFTNTGILNHSGSILNMGNLAKNLFKAEHKNIKFKDTHSYTARVQLYEGHNDFYHKNPRPLNYSIDLHFDSNYSIDSVLFCPINASYNWFEDNDIIISSPGIESRYAYCDYFDTSPNVFSVNSGRMAQAMDEESAENYYSANNMYKTILDENEVSESDLLFDALDAYYRTAELAGDTLSGTESYLLAKIDQYETDNPILTKYLEDYLVKNRLQAGDFQPAIDLLELRILNAESPVDSLHAVMNLEIVLQLATMSESKKPISTKLMQYKYPDRLTFKTKHEEHWKLLDELLNDEEIDLIPIPDKALISSNYPNPFNPSTTIAYSVPKDGLVKIGIYNIKGQKVKELCNSEMLRGHHKLVWDGKDKHQRNVGSGVYFVKMQSGGDVSTRKIMLMK